MDIDLSLEFQQYFLPSEKLIWVGRPQRGLKIRKSDVAMIPGSLFVLGFAIFWESGVLSTGASLFALFGIPFLIMGVYYVFGRFFHDAIVRAGQSYALTDKRVIIKQNQTIKSFELDVLREITLQDSKTILLEQDKLPLANIRSYDMFYGGSPARAMNRIEFIEDAQSVYNQIILARRQLLAQSHIA